MTIIKRIISLNLIVICFIYIFWAKEYICIPCDLSFSTYVLECEWGAKGSGDGQFDFPQGIAVDSFGYIYVADSLNNRVQKFTSDGEFILKITSGYDPHIFPSYMGFNSPRDVAIDMKNNIIIIADSGNQYIHKFDLYGNFIDRYYVDGVIQDIAVEPKNGKIIMADTFNNCVSGIDGEFNYPMGVAIDPRNGNIIVADTNNFRIQEFDSDGNFITKWGSQGNENGQFSKPQDVVVDNDGYIYILEMGNNRVQKFDSDGNFITKWPIKDNEKLSYLIGITVDLEKNIYVLDAGNNLVQKFVPINSNKEE